MCPNNRCLIAIAIMLLSSSLLFADVPQMLNYQGRLTDDQGDPVSATVSMSFAIYDAESGGNIKWTEAHPSVAVVEGLFAVILGNGSPAVPIDDSVFNAKDRWLEITVNGEIIGSRTRFTSSAYAMATPWWSFTDSVLMTNQCWGIARGGADNMLYGDNVWSHINLGRVCTTGSDGQNRSHATVSGGYGNKATESASTVGGGQENEAAGNSSTVSGGWNNHAYDHSGTVSGGNHNEANGEASAIGGGANNIATGSYNVIGGGGSNETDGGHSTVGGGGSNIASGDNSVVSGGWDNNALGQRSAVGGGAWNSTHASYSTIAGGSGNQALGAYGAIGGGYRDTVNGYYSAVCGGQLNVAGENADDSCAFVGGGSRNQVFGRYASVVGGHENIASGNFAFVGGGEINDASAIYAAITGGYGNIARRDYSAVLGGQFNTASAEHGSIGGGVNNVVNGQCGSIGGGLGNYIDSSYGAVSGGYGNNAGDHAFVGGGKNNSADSMYSTVSGGINNIADYFGATISGGSDNAVSGNCGVISGGGVNTVAGNYANICGGMRNYVGASYSVCLGGFADTVADWSFYSMTYGQGVYINNSNRVAFYDSENSGRFGLNRDDHDGGINHPIHVGTDATNGNGAHLTAGGTWTNGSSRHFKENFEQLNIVEFLNLIEALSVPAWNYKGSDERHIGPIAEDFVKLFDVGATCEDDGRRDDRYLSAGDVAGVALVGIKALIERLDKLEKRNLILEARITELEER